MRSDRMRIGAAIGFAMFVVACEVRTSERPLPTTASDSLLVVLRARFGIAPSEIAIKVDERVDILFDRFPWSSASEEVQFERAYDVAAVVWQSYGAAHGIDTVTVRTTTVIHRDSLERREYSFYPSQLTSPEPPVLASTQPRTDSRRAGRTAPSSARRVLPRSADAIER